MLSHSTCLDVHTIITVYKVTSLHDNTTELSLVCLQYCHSCLQHSCQFLPTDILQYTVRLRILQFRIMSSNAMIYDSTFMNLFDNQPGIKINSATTRLIKCMCLACSCVCVCMCVCVCVCVCVKIQVIPPRGSTTGEHDLFE